MFNSSGVTYAVLDSRKKKRSFRDMEMEADRTIDFVIEQGIQFSMQQVISYKFSIGVHLWLTVSIPASGFTVSIFPRPSR